MTDRTNRGWRYAVYAMYIVLCIGLQYYTERTQFTQLITLYGGLFLLYVLLLRKADNDTDHREGILLGMAARLVVVFAMPNLTDDHYRFLWDGQLNINGFSPYAYTPDGFRAAGHLGTEAYKTALYDQLNSKPYFTIYPPFYQAIFAIGANIGGINIYAQVLVIKILLMCFEFGTIYLLPKILEKLELPKHYALIYILNPLVIMELTGNMHLEGVMIFFLAWSIYLFLHNKHIFSAIAFGAAIATKLWPLMLMPLLFKQLGFKRTMQYSVIAGVTGILMLLPMLLHYANIFSSFNLYFQQFEFNGSIFFLGKHFFDKDIDYEAFSNMRASLPFIACFFILLFSAFYNKQYWYAAMLIVFSIYLLFATTVHPWYLTPLIFLSALSKLRYPLLWSGLIYLTYYTYITPLYIESYTFIWIEYLSVLGLAVYEFRGMKLFGRLFWTR